MTELRAEIDRVDRLIVPLLLERIDYVGQAGQYKETEDAVRDNDRVEQVVAKVMDDAKAQQGDDGYIEEIYRHLIERSINHELSTWQDTSL